MLLLTKREFLKGLILFLPAGGLLAAVAEATGAKSEEKTYDAASHFYGMGIEIDKCIGCSRCVEACKAENNVPKDMFHFRTWVERYKIRHDGDATVECISTQAARPAPAPEEEKDVVRTFFVPKLCNQCAHPPCTQVCPVGATFQTKDGVVLVDSTRCIGCRYCIQACPYGARFFNHRTRTADKCTFCYHRLVKGLVPACVEVCPTQARVFGDLRSKASRLERFERMNHIAVLKPALNTMPKVLYAELDGEVR